MIQRFVITGGPATGKSSIIEYFQKIGYPCFEEVSRAIIQEQNIQTSIKTSILKPLSLKNVKHSI